VEFSAYDTPTVMFKNDNGKPVITIDLPIELGFSMKLSEETEVKVLVMDLDL